MPRANSEASPARRLISTTKAVERLRVSDGSIRKFIAQGKLKGYRVAGLPRNLSVDVDEVDALLITVDNSCNTAEVDGYV